jgi:hypothetical protein
VSESPCRINLAGPAVLHSLVVTPQQARSSTVRLLNHVHGASVYSVVRQSGGSCRRSSSNYFWVSTMQELSHLALPYAVDRGLVTGHLNPVRW